MKRAAILILAIATLVLLGSPSTPLHADTNYTTKTGSGPSVIAPGGGVTGGTTVDTGGPAGSGGSNEGDADGLSGLKAPTTPKGYGALSYGDRVIITVKNLWRFMLWIR